MKPKQLADGLENVLKAAREITPAEGKLICIFGCGGDRDATKRPKMGKIAEELARPAPDDIKIQEMSTIEDLIDAYPFAMRNFKFSKYISLIQSVKNPIVDTYNINIKSIIEFERYLYGICTTN